MRGLKRDYVIPATGASMSHLLQMRGLKRNILKCNFMSAAVASFTDAWIETGKK